MFVDAVRFIMPIPNTDNAADAPNGDPPTLHADPDEDVGGLFEDHWAAVGDGIDSHSIAEFAVRMRRQSAVSVSKLQELGSDADAPRIEMVPAPDAVAQPTSYDSSLLYDEKSLVGARVAAMKKLLGDDGVGRDVEQLLNIANRVHGDAVDDPSEQVAVQLSMKLWIEESQQWAQANGEAVVDPADCVLAYQEMWSMVLNPPVLPEFKTRDQVAAAYRAKSPHSLRALFARQLPEVLGNYYSQFTTYIKTHLDQFCRAAIVAKAKEAGLGQLFIGYKPDRIWEIDGIRTELASPIPGGIKRWESRSAFVFAFPDGAFAFMDATGNITRLPAHAVNAKGELHPLVLNLLLPDRADKGDNNSCRLPGRIPEKYLLKPFRVSYDLSYHQSAPGSRSIKDMMSFQIRKGVERAIEEWKENNYNEGVAEPILNDFVPFFETGRKLVHDPGYKLQFKDIAFDLFGLALIVGTAGLAGMGGLKGVSLAVAAARAGTVPGKSVAGAVLRNIWALRNGKAFMIAAGRELTDFVVPVFSAQDLVKTITSRKSKPVVAELVMRLHLADGVMQAVPPAVMLDSIYGTLVRTRSVGSHISVSDLKAFIDEAADAAIPDSLFRGQAHMGPDSLKVPGLMHPDITRDDYLVACIKHSSRTGGGIDAPMSLSADRSVAARFASARPDGVVFTVDASKDAGNFRSIANILKYDGPRLVQEGKLRSGTLASAIKNAHVQGEKEFFYMSGLIPDAYIKAPGIVVGS